VRVVVDDKEAQPIEIDADHQSMIPKSMPSGFDPTGGNRFSDKIMLKSEIQTKIRVGS
jgi:hypothetical protein